jgi:filamentous hemagglutinin
MGDGSRSTHPNALPNYQNAVISRDKIEGYALNPSHEAVRPGGSSGKNKARVFKSVLGFDQSNWELLQQCIKEELPYYEAVAKEDNEYGKRYNVTLLITGPNGRAVDVLTAWIIKGGTDYPVLTTTYIVGV